ncbi:MAG TPA: serine protease [Ktedonobacterales bacterium]|nr:serine protease [Ktedonobacterales bacterium]
MTGTCNLERGQRRKRFCWRTGRTGMLVLLGVALCSLASGTVAQAAGFASGGLCTAARRGVALALPAVVRITSTYQAQVIYTSAEGSNVIFPQNGGSYALTISGAGAFISGTGDVLTAYSAVSAPQDTLNVLLAQRAAPDIAQALNDSHPGQTVAAADILSQLLTDPQSWQPIIQQPETALYLGSGYSGSAEAGSVANLQSYPVTILAQSSPDQPTNNDLAILHVDGLRDLPTIPLGDAAQVYQDDTLTIMGYPASADLPQSDGSVDPNNFITPSVKTVTVSAFKTAQDGAQLIQVDGNVEEGDSGAPALNADGQLIGVVSLAAGSGNGAGQARFLHPISDAQALIHQQKLNLAPDAFDTRWAAAYDACASTASGHWHDAYNQYSQIARLYPHFKGVQPYLAYTRAQAAHEPASGLNLPAWAIALIVAVVLAAAIVGFVLLRRRSLRKRAYAGYGPGLSEEALYGPGSTLPSGHRPAPLVASEQIGAAMPAGVSFLPTQSDPLTPASPDDTQPA